MLEKSSYIGKKDSVVAYVARVMDNFTEDDNLSVTIEKIGNLASARQEKLYWAAVTAFCKETGNDKDDMHQYFKEELLNKRMRVDKESLKDLTSAEMALFIEHLRKWAHENQFTLPI
jgi:hypothetical protein